MFKKKRNLKNIKINFFIISILIVIFAIVLTLLYFISSNTTALLTLKKTAVLDNAIIKNAVQENSELGITILNMQSYPAVGGNWVVKFNTTGVGNLTITASNGTTWTNDSEDAETYDLKFLQIRCGDSVLDYEWIGEDCTQTGSCSVFAQDYSCNETGHHTVKVLTSGGTYTRI